MAKTPRILAGLAALALVFACAMPKSLAQLEGSVLTVRVGYDREDYTQEDFNKTAASYDTGDINTRVNGQKQVIWYREREGDEYTIKAFRGVPILSMLQIADKVENLDAASEIWLSAGGTTYHFALGDLSSPLAISGEPYTPPQPAQEDRSGGNPPVADPGPSDGPAVQPSWPDQAVEIAPPPEPVETGEAGEITSPVSPEEGGEAAVTADPENGGELTPPEDLVTGPGVSGPETANDPEPEEPQIFVPAEPLPGSSGSSVPLLLLEYAESTGPELPDSFSWQPLGNGCTLLVPVSAGNGNAEILPSGSCTIDVIYPGKPTLTITDDEGNKYGDDGLTLAPSSRKHLNVTIVAENSNLEDFVRSHINWRSSDQDLVEVTEAGDVFVKGEGSATISVSFGAVSEFNSPATLSVTGDRSVSETSTESYTGGGENVAVNYILPTPEPEPTSRPGSSPATAATPRPAATAASPRPTTTPPDYRPTTSPLPLGGLATVNTETLEVNSPRPEIDSILATEEEELVSSGMNIPEIAMEELPEMLQFGFGDGRQIFTIDPARLAGTLQSMADRFGGEREEAPAEEPVQTVSETEDSLSSGAMLYAGTAIGLSFAVGFGFGLLRFRKLLKGWM